MYRQFNTTIKSDLKAAYKILERSQSLLQILEDDMAIEIGKLPREDDNAKLIHHIILSYRMYVIIYIKILS
jgi:hypothetical protein